jgi:hypothetical protein
MEFAPRRHQLQHFENLKEFITEFHPITLLRQVILVQDCAWMIIPYDDIADFVNRHGAPF